ncbi:MAG TPA: hypothetical protein VMM93_07570 [Vicinamibacterales bacterium]|nr:hypothetical protein [Vicinamibacterales bacterium]
MIALVVVGIVLLLVLAAFMAAAAWKLLREDRERSAARVAMLDELARENAAELGEPMHTRRPMSDREHDAALEAGWDLEIRPATQQADARVPEPRRLPLAEPRPEPVVQQATVQPDPPPVVADGMFGTAHDIPPGRPRGQFWTAAATAIVVLGVGTGMVYAVRHADAIVGIGRQLTSPEPSKTPLELISLRHTDTGGQAFTVTGFVQNPLGGGAARNVVAVVYLFDADGQYFASGRAPLDIRTLQPGDESPFVVTIPKVSGVTRYRVGFRTDEGDVVAHVDRRGSEPGGTTGEVQNGIDRNPDPPSTPRRVEG